MDRRFRLPLRRIIVGIVSRLLRLVGNLVGKGLGIGATGRGIAIVLVGRIPVRALIFQLLFARVIIFKMILLPKRASNSFNCKLAWLVLRLRPWKPSAL